MNDYFLRNMIRQRHEQILDEVSAARLSRLDRPRLNYGLKKMTRMFFSVLRLCKSPTVFIRTALDERKRI